MTRPTPTVPLIGHGKIWFVRERSRPDCRLWNQACRPQVAGSSVVYTRPYLAGHPATWCPVTWPSLTGCAAAWHCTHGRPAFWSSHSVPCWWLHLHLTPHSLYVLYTYSEFRSCSHFSSFVCRYWSFRLCLSLSRVVSITIFIPVLLSCPRFLLHIVPLSHCLSSLKSCVMPCSPEMSTYSVLCLIACVVPHPGVSCPAFHPVPSLALYTGLFSTPSAVLCPVCCPVQCPVPVATSWPLSILWLFPIFCPILYLSWCLLLPSVHSFVLSPVSPFPSISSFPCEVTHSHPCSACFV